MKAANITDASIIEAFLEWRKTAEDPNGPKYRYYIHKQFGVSYKKSAEIIEAYKLEKSVPELEEGEEGSLTSVLVNLLQPVAKQLKQHFTEEKVNLQNQHVKQLSDSREQRQVLAGALEEAEQKISKLNEEVAAKNEESQLLTHQLDLVKSDNTRLEVLCGQRQKEFDLLQSDFIESKSTVNRLQNSLIDIREKDRQQRDVDKELIEIQYRNQEIAAQRSLKQAHERIEAIEIRNTDINKELIISQTGLTKALSNTELLKQRLAEAIEKKNNFENSNHELILTRNNERELSMEMQIELRSSVQSKEAEIKLLNDSLNSQRDTLSKVMTDYSSKVIVDSSKNVE